MKLFNPVFAASIIMATMPYNHMAKAEEQCINHNALAKQISEKAKHENTDKLEFRIARAEDGQSLIYWQLGEKAGKFYAATFGKDGCAILTPNGQLRRLSFPRTAFNSGVFFEMDVFTPKF